MEENIIVLIEKDKDKKFLREIESYNIEKSEFVESLYAIDEDGLKVYLTLTTNKDVEDWQFNAIYDYIEIEDLEENCLGVEEVEDTYNPTFTFKLNYKENMEEDLNTLIEDFSERLLSAYEVIEQHKEEYL